MRKRLGYILGTLCFVLLLIITVNSTHEPHSPYATSCTTTHEQTQIPTHTVSPEQQITDLGRMILASLKSDATTGYSGSRTQHADPQTARTVDAAHSASKMLIDNEQGYHNQYKGQQHRFSVCLAQLHAQGHYIFSLRRIII